MALAKTSVNHSVSAPVVNDAPVIDVAPSAAPEVNAIRVIDGAYQRTYRLSLVTATRVTLVTGIHVFYTVDVLINGDWLVYSRHNTIESANSDVHNLNVKLFDGVISGTVEPLPASEQPVSTYTPTPEQVRVYAADESRLEGNEFANMNDEYALAYYQAQVAKQEADAANENISDQILTDEERARLEFINEVERVTGPNAQPLAGGDQPI